MSTIVEIFTPMKTLIAVLAVLTTVAFAEAPKWGDDLSKTVHQATRENKLGFIVLGREQCGNCQATKRLVNDGKIPVTTDTFVIADLTSMTKRPRRSSCANIRSWSSEAFFPSSS